MFNIFKRKTYTTGKVEPLEPWPPPPEDTNMGLPKFPEDLIPMPEVKPPKEEPERNIVSLLMEATARKAIAWAWDVDTQQYYIAFTTERMFAVGSKPDEHRPIDYIRLRYWNSEFVTTWENDPDIDSLYQLVKDISSKKQQKSMEKDLDWIEEELQKVKGKEDG